MRLLTLILLFTAGLIWVLTTLLLRDRIKKLWLYTLFPTLIYSIPLVARTLTRAGVDAFLATLVIVYVYMLLRALRGLDLRDAVFIPLAVISLNILVALFSA